MIYLTPGRLFNFMGLIGRLIDERRLLERGVYFYNRYTACTRRRKFTSIFSKELKDVKERYPYFNFELEHDMISKPTLKKAW